MRIVILFNLAIVINLQKIFNLVSHSPRGDILDYSEVVNRFQIVL